MSMDVGDESIDDSLYSRQRYVLGDAAMKRMAASKVFLSGLGGVGIEIAKNVALAGIKALTLHDTKAAHMLDLGAQFYLSEEDVKEGRSRLSVSAAALAELNPYVKIETSAEDLATADLSMLDAFKCVVLTDCSLAVQERVNDYCHNRGIGFLAADVRGVFAWSFVDLGTDFEVVDANGERPKAFLLDHMEAGEVARAHCLEHHRHDLQTGDAVKIQGVGGPWGEALGDTTWSIKVDSPFTFILPDISATMSEDSAKGKGQVQEVKVPIQMSFKSLKDSLKEPETVLTDFTKFERPPQQHLAARALLAFQATHDEQLPRAWHKDDTEEMLKLAGDINAEASHVETVDEAVVAALAHTARGTLAPLAAFMGGIMGQEVLKALSGKFTPLKQWMHVDCMEVLPKGGADGKEAGARTDALKLCVGQEGVDAVASTRLFMVGAGAIGCEMMKNYAMLGAGLESAGGCISVTDNDLIERSNLNRQFLFRAGDINEPKSTTAAKAVVAMNAGVRVEAHMDKMGAESEDLYPDSFYAKQDIIVNALDNLQARLYMDGRAVATQKPLLESGTLGAKGHVQVVVPHKSESYASQQDPETKDIAYCTLKSFPSTMDHCIVWARDLLFEDYFRVQPADYLLCKTTEDLGTKLDGRVPEIMKAVTSAAAALEHRPSSYKDCVAFARAKFEEFYRNSALQLLDCFPLDHKTDGGKLFWSNPKRPPTPLQFDANDQLHADFVYTWAALWAAVWGITDVPTDTRSVAENCEGVEVPAFVSKKVNIVTDEAAAAPKEEVDEDLLTRYVGEIRSHFGGKQTFDVTPQAFEKDVDENHHIAFITAAANLRARVYGIAEVNKIEVKRIAGNITPAIATTTSAVSGLVTLELLKLRLQCDFTDHRNAFLTLALPAFQLAEVAEAPKRQVTKDIAVTLWDRWDVYGSPECTLGDVFAYFDLKFKLEVDGMVQGASVVYMKCLHMMHKARLSQPAEKWIKDEAGQGYCDIVLNFKDKKGEVVEGNPVVRFFFSDAKAPEDLRATGSMEQLEKKNNEKAAKRSSKSSNKSSSKSSKKSSNSSKSSSSSKSSRKSSSKSSKEKNEDAKSPSSSSSSSSSKGKSRSSSSKTTSSSSSSHSKSGPSKGSSKSGSKSKSSSKSSCSPSKTSSKSSSRK